MTHLMINLPPVTSISREHFLISFYGDTIDTEFTVNDFDCDTVDVDITLNGSHSLPFYINFDPETFTMRIKSVMLTEKNINYGSNLVKLAIIDSKTKVIAATAELTIDIFYKYQYDFLGLNESVETLNKEEIGEFLEALEDKIEILSSACSADESTSESQLVDFNNALDLTGLSANTSLF